MQCAPTNLHNPTHPIHHPLFKSPLLCFRTALPPLESRLSWVIYSNKKNKKPKRLRLRKQVHESRKMINSVAKNISRGWSSQICNNAPRISSLGGHHHITCKFPTFTLHSSRTFSSSSSGSHFGGFLKWYLGMLQTRPFTTKGISSSLIFAAADFTSQVHFILTLYPHP